MGRRKLPKWFRLELDLLQRLRRIFKNVYYQYPLAIKDEETHRIFIHKIDYVIEYNGERIAIELDGEIHHRSKRQINKTEWRNRNILRHYDKLVIVDAWEYNIDPEKTFQKLLREIGVET